MANDTQGSAQSDSEFVTIVVGIGGDADGCTFCVPKSILTKSSSFFRGCPTSSHFPEGRNNHINHPEDDPKAFDIVLQFLFEGEKLEDWNWPVWLSPAALHDPILVFAYILADKLGLEDVCNQIMENIQVVLNLCRGYCAHPHDIEHVFSGLFRGSRLFDLSDSKLKDYLMRQLVEDLSHNGLWHYCECRKDCKYFTRCKCKPICVCLGRGTCDTCLGRYSWHCVCDEIIVIGKGCCEWCQFISSDDARAAELKEATAQHKRHRLAGLNYKPDGCEFHVHIDTEQCYGHHRPAHLVGKVSPVEADEDDARGKSNS